MNRAPVLTDEEADRIIAYYRELREKFAAQEAAPKAPRTRKGPARPSGPLLSADDILAGLE